MQTRFTNKHAPPAMMPIDKPQTQYDVYHQKALNILQETRSVEETPVTLSWQVSGASYIIVSPEIGATRGTSATVHPTATTTYTLYANNAFGQTISTVTITVH